MPLHFRSIAKESIGCAQHIHAKAQSRQKERARYRKGRREGDRRDSGEKEFRGKERWRETHLRDLICSMCGEHIAMNE
jgi:hypothetical protein